MESNKYIRRAALMVMYEFISVEDASNFTGISEKDIRDEMKRVGGEFSGTSTCPFAKILDQEFKPEETQLKVSTPRPKPPKPQENTRSWVNPYDLGDIAKAIRRRRS